MYKAISHVFEQFPPQRCLSVQSATELEFALRSVPLILGLCAFKMDMCCCGMNSFHPLCTAPVWSHNCVLQQKNIFLLNQLVFFVENPDFFPQNLLFFFASLPQYNKNPFTNNIEDEEHVVSECSVVMVLNCTTAESRHRPNT